MMMKEVGVFVIHIVCKVMIIYRYRDLFGRPSLCRQTC